MNDHPTPDPTTTGNRAAVRTDAGGWLSGPGLPAVSLPPEPPPAMLGTVLHIAGLGAELPLWRVTQNAAGDWTGVRAVTDTAGPIMLTRLLLSTLEPAMFGAELAIVRAENPGWSIRRTEHGRGWTATAGGPPVLTGRTLGELAAQISEASDRQ